MIGHCMIEFTVMGLRYCACLSPSVGMENVVKINLWTLEELKKIKPADTFRYLIRYRQRGVLSDDYV